MPRKPRIEYAGAVYHVMSRGVKGLPIFTDAGDYEIFSTTLGEACIRTGWIIHSWVMMATHYHVLLETPEPNLVQGMKWFQSAYAQRFNVRHGERGQVFQGRYKALMIDPDAEGYFETLSTYIHLNPVRAGLLKVFDLTSYGFSSYPHFIVPRDRPGWLVVTRVLGNLGLNDNRSGRQAYARYMQDQIAAWQDENGRKTLAGVWRNIRRSWCLGDDVFRELLLDRMGGVLASHQPASYSGEAVEEHNEQLAQRLITAGLKALDLNESELPARHKGDECKCALAWLAHSRTTVSHRWLSERLHMGSVTSMTHYLNRMRTPVSTSDFDLRRRMDAIGNSILKYED